MTPTILVSRSLSARRGACERMCCHVQFCQCRARVLCVFPSSFSRASGDVASPTKLWGPLSLAPTRSMCPRMRYHTVQGWAQGPGFGTRRVSF